MGITHPGGRPVRARHEFFLPLVKGGAPVRTKFELDFALGRQLERVGAPGKIRTPNLLIRSQTLYPVELRAHRPGKTPAKEGRNLRQGLLPRKT